MLGKLPAETHPALDEDGRVTLTASPFPKSQTLEHIEAGAALLALLGDSPRKRFLGEAAEEFAKIDACELGARFLSTFVRPPGLCARPVDEDATPK